VRLHCCYCDVELVEDVNFATLETLLVHAQFAYVPLSTSGKE
jgi:hypothetical protein